MFLLEVAEAVAKDTTTWWEANGAAVWVLAGTLVSGFVTWLVAQGQRHHERSRDQEARAFERESRADERERAEVAALVTAVAEFLAEYPQRATSAAYAEDLKDTRANVNAVHVGFHRLRAVITRTLLVADPSMQDALDALELALGNDLLTLTRSIEQSLDEAKRNGGLPPGEDTRLRVPGPANTAAAFETLRRITRERFGGNGGA